MGVLRHRAVGRLQDHIDNRIAIAAQLIAEKLIFASRAAGQEQHAILAVDDFDIGLTHQIARQLLSAALAGGELHAKLQRAAARLLNAAQLELDPLLLSAAGKDDRLLPLGIPARGIGGARLAGGPRKQFHLDLPGHPLRFDFGGHGEAVARISPRRRREIGDSRTDRFLI